MNRINKIFEIKTKKVIPFITAGYPSMNDTVDIVLAAEEAGASMMEIGMPFSDPLADGPIIQRSSEIAIKNGVTISWIFETIIKIRQKSEIPIALMGYINPIIKYGITKFIKESKEVGVDGLIIPDLPLEEAGEYVVIAKNNQICPILLVAPNSSADRIKKISGLSGGLIYCVAILGITGTKKSKLTNLKTYLDKVNKNSCCPFIVGFGIKDRSDVVRINSLAHGAVVGSAIIKELEGKSNPEKAVKYYINRLLL